MLILLNNFNVEKIYEKNINYVNSFFVIYQFFFAGDHKANIIVVTHGSDTDAFWGVVRNGVEAAKKDTGADVQYRNPPTGDLNEMASLIEAAIAQKPDGIVVSIPAPDILGGPIKAAVAAGIPVTYL